MQALEALCHAHGGKFTVQSGTQPGAFRDYWLIYHSLQPHSVGAITQSAEIHRSWAMRPRLQEDAKWRRKLQVYSLVYLIEGNGIFFDERTRRERAVQAGDLLCLFPNIGHVYAPQEGTRWNEINVEFAGLVFDAWMGADLLDPEKPVRHLEPVPYWNARFHEVVVPLAREGTRATLVDTARLIGLIAEMCSTWLRPAQEADVGWAEKARKQLLTLAPGHPLDQPRLARSFGLGDQAYRKKFKRLCGVTPTEFRARYVIEQACHLLATSAMPIKEIAFALGFGNEFYFMRRFKQITGAAPGEYRRSRIQ